MNAYRVFVIFLFISYFLNAQEANFEAGIDNIDGKVPWSSKAFNNDTSNFKFAIISDRTFGHRPGVFGKGINALNLIQPEFVISIGDMIEGETHDLDEIHQQWNEFDSILDPLQMKYFYLPGNHDYTNQIMAKEWEKKLGQSYYYFKYKNSLFLVLNANAEPGDIALSKKQIAYFKKGLETHKEVKWTFVFMHQPLWYSGNNRFSELEEALADRPYTVFAGHRHRYRQEIRNGRIYIALGTTGGGIRLRGEKLGEFDHVTSVSVRPDGPVITNLKLDGVLPMDIAQRKDENKISALSEATDFKELFLFDENNLNGKIALNIKNNGNDTIYFNGSLQHHQQLNFNTSKIDAKINPNSKKDIFISWHLLESIDFMELQDIILNYAVSYKTEINEPKFEIRSDRHIKLKNTSSILSFNAPRIFIEDQTVKITSEFDQFDLYYTTGNEDPTKESEIYTSPFTIKKSTKIKARIIDAQTGFSSKIESTDYNKVKFIPATTVPRTKLSTGLTYKQFNGRFGSVDEFKNRTPAKEGSVFDFDVNKIMPAEADNFGLEYNGLVDIPEDGLYIFKSVSDDGSKIYINDKLVVDNDRSTPNRTAIGYIPLKKGLHPIKVLFCERGGEQFLECSLKLQQAENFIDITNNMLFHYQ